MLDKVKSPKSQYCTRENNKDIAQTSPISFIEFISLLRSVDTQSPSRQLNITCMRGANGKKIFY